MIKKQFFYVLASCLFIVNMLHAKSKTNLTTVTGHLNFESKTGQVTLHHVVDGQLEVHSTTLVNQDGDFGFQIPVKVPGFYFVDYGQYNDRLRGQVIRLYIQPGLEIKMDINEGDYILKGKKNGYNDLVQKANSINNTFREYNRIGGLITYKDFFPFLEDEGTKMVEAFKQSINTKDKDFNELLKLAVQADYETELYMFFQLPRVAHPEKDNRPQQYRDLFSDGIKFSNPDVLKLDNGVMWMYRYFYYYRYHLDAPVPKLEIIENDIKHISDVKIKEIYILAMLKRIKFKPEEYEKIIPPLYKYLTSEKSKNYTLEYEKQLHKDKGQAGFEFTYEDVDGNPVSFADFRGKFVYIDVWATWCGPCKKQIPYLKELEHDYKGKDIVFVSISVDKIKDKQKWIDFVRSEDLGGVQLMVDNDFSSGIAKNYEINAIPRFLLFDKEGKIISTDAMRPSDPLLKEQFDELLGLEKN
ncbi:TlpA disulfide reductase family protein [Aestuariibaculum sp. YM273]|uniref:TlpA family protein disulfide reductase n=1 Tax=Aestuariibaculum sp. YM273 TaxID=3070659 RepID=UPI0027DE7C99|nr:TlpA disulfide reductase family protein [Aestuariibaculum sp. YM273]WMI64132.1 TlpA disulfide reductase family protein [Aestuariibaculum sp. YM273]